MTTYTCSTLQNINTIAESASAGDIIELAIGRHTLAPIYINPTDHAHGTSGSPITITSASGGTATISYAWSSSGTYQILIEDMDYWIVDDVNVENYVNNAVIVSAKTRDSTGCQIRNVDVDNQSINTSAGLGFDAGYHPVIFGGEPTNTSVGTLKDFEAYNVNVTNARPWNDDGYNEAFTVFGACDGVLIDNCSVNQSHTGIAFNCLGAGWGIWTPSWRAGQPHNVTWTNNSVVDLRNYGNICNAFYGDRCGAGCVWDGNFAINVKTLFAWGYEPGFAGGCSVYGDAIFRNNRGVIQANGVYGGTACTGMEVGSYDESNTHASGDIDVYNNTILFKGMTGWCNGIVFRRCTDGNIYNNVVYLHSSNDGISFTGWNTANTYEASWIKTYSNNQYFTAAGGGTWALPYQAATGSITSWNGNAGVSGEFIKQPTFTDVDGDSYSDFYITNGGTTTGRINADFSYTKSGLTVNFTDESESDEGIDDHAWDFNMANEGTDTSTATNPTNVYASDGTYTVRLTVSGDDGADSHTDTVSVSGSGGGDGSIIEQVGASGDDCEGNAGSWWYNNLNYCSFGDKESASSNYDFSSGLRFTLSEAIPSDAIITSATLSLYSVWKDGASLPTARIQAENASNPGAWAGADTAAKKADYDGRTLTTAYKDWSISSWNLSTWYTSPDFSSVIQELVDDHTGLASGAHIAMRIGDSGSGWGGNNTLISFQSYDGGAANAAKLTVEWDTPPTSKRILKQETNTGINSQIDWGLA